MVAWFFQKKKREIGTQFDIFWFKFSPLGFSVVKKVRKIHGNQNVCETKIETSIWLVSKFFIRVEL